MNERICKLYEQSYESKPIIVVDPITGQPVHCTGHNDKPLYHRELNLEKFAELIVRECADQCTTDGSFCAEVVWGKQFNKKILKHFGVEE